MPFTRSRGNLGMKPYGYGLSSTAPHVQTRIEYCLPTALLGRRFDGLAKPIPSDSVQLFERDTAFGKSA